MATAPFTSTSIGVPAGAATFVENDNIVLCWRHTPVSFGIEMSISMRDVLEAESSKDDVAVSEEHTVGALSEPVIVCVPFLNESCTVTDGILVDGSSAAGVMMSCVCGAESRNHKKIPTAMIVAVTHSRVCFMR